MNIDEPADDSAARNRDHRPTRVMFVAVALAIALLANAFATAYVGSERYIYYWDWSRFWSAFGTLGELFRTNLPSALNEIAGSISTDDYNYLPLVPLVPFEMILGPGRLSYVLAITNVALLPSAALMALVADRTMRGRCLGRYLLAVGTVLCLHVLWTPALRGLPDAVGVVIACLILLTYFSASSRSRLLRLAGLGALFCVLTLTRRWYAFWAAAFFPAALVAYVVSPNNGGLRWKGLVAKGEELAIVGVGWIAFVLLLAGPLVVRIAHTDYSSAYAAYRPDLAGGSLGQIYRNFGCALLIVAGAGLATLVIRKQSRELGVLLSLQSAISMGLFMHVQGLLGVQHYYLLLPAAGIGLAGLVGALWDAHWSVGLRAMGIAGLMGVVLLSSARVFLPGSPLSMPLLPAARYAPLVRPDVAEVDRLLDALAELRPESVYVAASSEILNWSTLQVECKVRHPELCPHLAVSQDIDTRDGFPRNILAADYVVLATPTQYHVRPKDQQVIGLVAQHVREHSGFGSSFEPVPGEEFRLMDGVRVQIYRRDVPLRAADIESLRQELMRSYPQSRSLFVEGGRHL